MTKKIFICKNMSVSENRNDSLQKVTNFIRQKTILFYFVHWSSLDELLDGLLAPFYEVFWATLLYLVTSAQQEKMTLAC